MTIGATGNYSPTEFLKFGGQSSGVFHNLSGIFFESGRICFTQGHGNGRRLIHMGSALESRENSSIYFLWQFARVYFCKYESPARTTQSLVGRSRNNIGVWKRRRIDSASDQTCYMRHINHE